MYIFVQIPSTFKLAFERSSFIYIVQYSMCLTHSYLNQVSGLGSSPINIQNVEDTCVVLTQFIVVKKMRSYENMRGEEKEHKGGCRFGMLLLNLCTWEQHCLAQGILLYIRWGNMLQLTQQWGTHAKVPFPNLVLIHTKHIGAMCSSWVLQIYNRNSTAQRILCDRSFHLISSQSINLCLSQIAQNRKTFS